LCFSFTTNDKKDGDRNEGEKVEEKGEEKVEEKEKDKGEEGE
jgi:hypothetical protein